MRDFTLRDSLSVKAAAVLLVSLLLLALNSHAQDAGDDPLVSDYPPSGDRLRDLADRLDFSIGFAARYDWAALEQAELYETITAAEFNIITPENSVKWINVHPLQDDYDFGDMDTLRAFADSNGMVIHGHPLTWYGQNPLWAEELLPSELELAMQQHIAFVVGRYKGGIKVWDVVNEALNDEGTDYRVDNNIFYAAMGAEYIDKAFIAARAADSAAVLLYNDFGIGWLNAKSDRAFELVTDLQDRDIPVDGVGLQMHIDHTFEHGEGFSANMQRIADRGLEVWLTEFDVGVLQTTDYEKQGEVYEDIIQRCLMQPACKAVQIWGLDDFHSWRPFFDPLPFDDNFRIKPAYYGMQRALMSQPVHPESCILTDAVVQSGAVFPGASGSNNSGNLQPAISCDQVALANGFASVTVRYRNPGVDTPSLSLHVGEQELGQVELPPTVDSDDGDYLTIKLPVVPVAGLSKLVLEFEGQAGDIGLDALLFSDPIGSLLGTDSASNSAGNESSGGAAGALILTWLMFLALRRVRGRPAA
ncbi:MAG: endo-1,4-beta-xylanase [Granulosicoccus sp.]